MQDPSVTTWRSRRDHEVQPEEGKHYKDSALKRFAQGRKIEMFPFNMGNSRSDSPSEHSKKHA